MEQQTENIVRELVRLNMERLYRFLSASTLIRQTEARRLISRLAAQSEGFIMELEYVIKLYGGSVGSAASQTLKDTAFDRASTPAEPSVLLRLVQQEKDALGTYQRLLESGRQLDNNLFEKIRAQKSELQQNEIQLGKFITV